MFESGRYVETCVEPTTERQVQPNGVDLTLEAVFEQTGRGRLGRDGKRVGDRSRIAPDSGEDPTVYTLSPGGYVARYGEVIRVPDDHVGFVFPRSSLMRNSCMLNTAVWDAGYEGQGEGLLQVHHPIEIEPGARIAQFVLAAADHQDTYDGTYQGENIG